MVNSYTPSFIRASILSLLFLTLYGGFTTCVEAQNSGKPPRTLSLGVANVNAVGTFGRQMPNQIWGFSGNYSWASHKLPFKVGFDLGFTNWGKEYWEDWYYQGENPTWAEYRLGSHLVTLGIALRYEPTVSSRFLPYGELTTGVGIFGTYIHITDPDLNSSCPKALEIIELENDNAGYARIGAGLMLPFGYDPELGKRQAYLDFGVLYHFGGNASYMTPGSVESSRSRTDMILLRLMVGLYI